MFSIIIIIFLFHAATVDTFTAVTVAQVPSYEQRGQKDVPRNQKRELQNFLQGAKIKGVSSLLKL